MLPSRLGFLLFLFYTAFYLGFVLINAFAPQWMERVVWQGLNWATLYGFLLIIVAVVLALIYGLAHRSEAE